MQKRTAVVDTIEINTIEFGSICNIGDTIEAKPKMRGIALQKEGTVFTGDENLAFENYSLFHREAIWPTQKNIVNTRTTHHHSPLISVGSVSTDLNGSSIFQIGSIQNINAEARIKYFRRLLGSEQNE